MRPKQQCGPIWGKQVNPNWLVQQQQLLVRNRGCEFGNESMNVKCTRRSCLPQSAWPPLQVQNQNNRLQFNGSGSRVVPGGSSVKRGCGGTGVFLPRHYEAPLEPRKKTGKLGLVCFLVFLFFLSFEVSVGCGCVLWCVFLLLSGCAPVLLPAKVVHALNLNINDLNGTSQTCFSNAFAADYGEWVFTSQSKI